MRIKEGNAFLWEAEGWREVTPEEAQQMLSSGANPLFLCEDCRRALRLHRRVRGSFFIHESPLVPCEKRERPLHPMLPLRLRPLSGEKVLFEVGLLPVEGVSGPLRVIVSPEGEGRTGQISEVTLKGTGPVFAAAGNVPAPLYRLAVEPLGALENPGGPRDRALRRWPALVEGVRPEGCLFAGDTGIMIPEEGEVLVGRDYLLLTPEQDIRSREGLSCRRVFSFEAERQVYSVYAVRATAPTREAAVFLWNKRARLSPVPRRLTPLWPPVRRQAYGLLYEEGPLWFYAPQGQAGVYAGPPGEMTREGEEMIFRASGQEEELLLSGRPEEGTFLSLWPAFLDPALPQEVPPLAGPLLRLFDEKGEDIPTGECALPASGRIHGYCEAKGRVCLFEEGHLLFEGMIPSGEEFILSGIQAGYQVVFYVGAEKAGELLFRRERSFSWEERTEAEGRESLLPDDLLPLLVRPRGPRRQVPGPALAWAIEKAREGSELERYLMRAQREGYLCGEAWKRIVHMYEKGRRMREQWNGSI